MTRPSSRFDLAAVLDRLPAISDFFTRAGNEPKKIGSAMFAFCPFHTEKTRSCQVIDAKGKYHCYGCGADGDVMDFWRHTRGLSFLDALAELAGMANVAPDQRPIAKAAPKAAAPAAPPTPLPLAARHKWQAATERLAGSEAEIGRIAEWRGIAPDCVRWAAEQGIMGSYPYWSEMREAFLVEAFAPAAPERVPVSVHCRLAPGSKGNFDEKKATWRYDPVGVGAWPVVIGSPETAKHLFVIEGQWDALALVSVMGWHRRWPGGTALFALRGANSFRKVLAHPIHPDARIFAFADADPAGDGWAREGDFYDQLASRLTHPERLHNFRPSTEGLDFNDLVKRGDMTRDAMLALILPCLPDRRHAQVPTFRAWCRADPCTTARAFVAADRHTPGSRRPLPAWQRHWNKLAVPDALFAELVSAFHIYKSDCRAAVTR